MSRINSYTRWERRSHNCQRCVTPVISGPLLSAPIPLDVQSKLSEKLRAKIAQNCRATFPLPPLPTIGTISTSEISAEESRLSSCTPFVDSKTSLCGNTCGSSSNIYNITPQYPGCKTSNNSILPIGSKIINSRTECQTTKELGAGATISAQVKYKANYCLSNARCNTCVEEFFFAWRTLPTKIAIKSNLVWTLNESTHCCWPLPNGAYAYIECTACCGCPPPVGAGSIPVIQGHGRITTNFGWNGTTTYRASNNPTEWRILSGPSWVSIEQFGPIPAVRYNPPCTRISGWPWWKCGEQSTERHTVEIQARNSFGWSMPFCIAIEVRVNTTRS